MAIRTLPTPPSRLDPANFAVRGDAWNAGIQGVTDDINAVVIANLTQGTEATAAKNAAIAAWAASMAPAETLPAISKSLHYGAIVKAIIYDTSKDSDGGAWRKRCADKSWYTEALGFTGAWGGQCANVATGWAACGSVVGGAYQSTADGKFYTPLSSSTQTEIFRGNVREFPEQVAIVIETGKMVIYDLTQAGCPMWMVFTRATNNALDTIPSSVAAMNGQIVFGASSGVYLFGFIADLARNKNTSSYTYKGNFAARNALANWVTSTDSVIINNSVNDVAITALDGAPIDPATGLPVPTVAVATSGGISVIKDDGTVVNSSQTDPTVSVAFSGSMLYISNRGGVTAHARFISVVGLGASWTPATLYSYLVNGGTWDESKVAQYGKGVATSGNAQLAVYKHNPADTSKSLRAQITTAFNSGWMVGDCKGAYLADISTAPITASGELVTNGDFPTAITGWTAKNATLAVVSGELEATATSGSSSGAYQQIVTVVGKTYNVTGSVRAPSANTGVRSARIRICESVSRNTTLGTAFLSAEDATQLLSLTFVATTTTTVIDLDIASDIAWGSSGDKAYFDNISCKLAEPDRSVKNKGLTVVGTVTKSAVATGAALVGYSGFSTSNYLEQPYNSDLDFGTGDFSVMGWVDAGTLTTGQYIFGRGAASNPTIALYHTTGGAIGLVCSATASATDGVATLVAGINHLALVRVSGVIQLYLNGVSVYSAANTANVTNTTAALIVGAAYDRTTPYLGKLALWRISATAPSADQVSHIYRTELPLFQTNAQCTIAGSSTSVTALAYDDTTEVLHVATTYGRSGFKDLLRIDSEATTNGLIASLSANQGAVLTGGESAASYYQPAMLLRDELRRKDEARKALGKTPVFFDFTATASQTAFVLPKGYAIKAVYHNGTLKRETTTGVYWTRSSDGFAETCTLSAGATVSDWISIMAVRS